MSIEIIKANENDLAVIQEIVNITWPDTYTEIVGAEQIKYMIKMFYSNEALLGQMRHHHQFILAKINDEIFGFASYEFNFKNTKKTRIHKIYVLPKAQGKNIGKSMMDYIGNEAKLNNNSILNLNVNRFNKAVNFYEKMNFIKTKTEDIDIGNGYLMEDFVMEKMV